MSVFSCQFSVISFQLSVFGCWFLVEKSVILVRELALVGFGDLNFGTSVIIRTPRTVHIH
ncbi:MAG TPA: hypothetical protein ENJ89_01070 [Caldithrix abyssi]|uniref:Uncharacterized protein n=1 Tax=Caldithrix abyssi TaxID=187145 RepID=A0A7V5PMK7_CALAY|nr:hypothetical protein [Caldithrix abyssi]